MYKVTDQKLGMDFLERIGINPYYVNEFKIIFKCNDVAHIEIKRWLTTDDMKVLDELVTDQYKLVLK